MELTIREACAKDNQVLIDLARQTVFSNGLRSFYNDRNPDYFARIGLLPGGRCFVGDFGGQVVGVGSLALDDLWFESDYTRIGYVFDAKVSAAFQGQGFGEQLYLHRERVLQEAGCSYIYKIIQHQVGTKVKPVLKWDFHYAGALNWYALFPFFREKLKAGLSIRPAEPCDLTEIVDLLRRCWQGHWWSPRFSETYLEGFFKNFYKLDDFLVALQGTKIKAVLSLIDTQYFKKLICLKAPWLHRVMGELSRIIKIFYAYPDPARLGQPSRSKLVRFAAYDGSIEWLGELLKYTLNQAHQHNYQFIFIGMDANSPLNHLPRRVLTRSTSQLNIYLKSFNGALPGWENLPKKAKYLDPLIV